MRSKLFTAVLSLFAMAALTAGPISASAEVVELQSEKGEPIEVGAPIQVQIGSFSWFTSYRHATCPASSYETELTANGEGSVTLAGAGQEITCVDAEAVFDLDLAWGVFEFASGHTGSLPLSYDGEVKPPWGNTYLCDGDGTLDVTWYEEGPYENNASAFGEVEGDSVGCGDVTLLLDSLKLMRMEEGEPVEELALVEV